MMNTPDEQHRMPKPVADMFRVLELGAVDERREAQLLDHVEAKLRTEAALRAVKRPLLVKFVRNSPADTTEPSEHADPRVVLEHVDNVAAQVSGGLLVSVSGLAKALIDAGMPSGVWRIIMRGLGALLLLAGATVAIVSSVVWDSYSLLVVAHVVTLWWFTRHSYRRRKKSAATPDGAATDGRVRSAHRGPRHPQRVRRRRS